MRDFSLYNTLTKDGVAASGGRDSVSRYRCISQNEEWQYMDIQEWQQLGVAATGYCVRHRVRRIS